MTVEVAVFDGIVQELAVMIIISSAVAPTQNVSPICSSATVTKIVVTAPTKLSAVYVYPRFFYGQVQSCSRRLSSVEILLFVNIHRESKKGATLTMAITLSILDRFAKFFHCCKQQ